MSNETIRYRNYKAGEKMTEITEEEFWDNVNALPPLLRFGYSNGPGAFLCSEPSNERRCAITGKHDYTYTVCVVLPRKDPLAPQMFGPDDDGYERDYSEPNPNSQFFEHDEPLTLNEFKALCDRIMPGTGVCSMGWGEELLDANGNLRADIEYPVRRYCY
jgi:hypothetical protein